MPVNMHVDKVVVGQVEDYRFLALLEILVVIDAEHFDLWKVQNQRNMEVHILAFGKRRQNDIKKCHRQVNKRELPW